MTKHWKKRSTIETKMPLEIRQDLNRLLLEDSYTYEEVSAWCKQRGYDISKSAIGRYGKDFFEAYKSIQQFEEQARVLTSEPGTNMTLEEATGKLITKKVLSALISNEVDILEQNKLISAFAALQNSNVKRESMKVQFADRAKKVADDVQSLVKKQGLTDDAAETIRQKILGVAG